MTDLTATEVIMRQHEWNQAYEVAVDRALTPYVKSIEALMFSRRGMAIYFGVKRRPVSSDMAQMLDDINIIGVGGGL